MGTSSGLGFTSEEELKRSEMIIVTFVSVLLLISGSNAQFQGNCSNAQFQESCPMTKDCEYNEGKCFGWVCPGGYDWVGMIGPCRADSRGCVCCKSKRLRGKCPEDPNCEARGGKCQYPKCKKGYREIGKCRSKNPSPCKCCQPIKG